MRRDSNRLEMTIGGAPVDTADRLDVINPATEEVCGSAPVCDRVLLDRTVAAARSAFPTWRAAPFAQRQRLMVAIADTIVSNSHELAKLLTVEQGKPAEAALGEVMGGAHWWRATSTLELPVTVNEHSNARLSETVHVPIGVVGTITPWNVPFILACLKVAPAMLAGNTVVLKPSPSTPLSALRLGELLRDVLPPGVLNVISGQDDLGRWMTDHPGIDMISFTGSTATGRKVMAGCGATLKRLTLELGGNDAAIVMPGVDIAKTADAIFWAAFGNSGQKCIATKRLYVHHDVHAPLRDALVRLAGEVRVGNGQEQGVHLGPLQNRRQYEQVRDLIRDCVDNGYRIVAGGVPVGERGYFVPVTIVDNPPEASRIVREEQFGPVLPILPFADLDDAIARSNDSEYGLGASVFVPDAAVARSVADRLEAGTVWINESQYLSPLAAFAGHKSSGFGVESGRDGLLEFTLRKTITTAHA